ncbi:MULTISPECIES: peptidoglycan-binding domain-containing protein [unclassified Bradyrhizobium]|uniref:peptidoglycan-binding domain-containing protein n=1 Tax=unclassified Bradyrhizobium TaxID=2631580 RepID=UPI002915F964|nr:MULTISPECIES: peptidoglycan-binding domain-containing protein [unclassified Bradyrhizobium]
MQLGIRLAIAMAIVSGVTGVAAAENDAQKDATAVDEACFAASYEKSHGPVKKIFLRGRDRALAIELWGVPHMWLFTAPMLPCGKAGANLDCTIECDGGHFFIAFDKAGHARVSTKRLSMIPFLDTAVPGSVDADEIRNTGVYDLATAPPEICTTAFDIAGRAGAVLRAGDFTPRVLSLERMLSELGYFAEVPDWYFTAKTEASLRLFQKAMGLNETGVADDSTMRLLRSEAKRGEGC